MARRPPWYAFLYLLLGAHGTFWLWVVTVATLWWTWHGAVLSLVNRAPERRSVDEAASAGDLRRWVVLPGVRVTLDGQLLLVEDPSDFQGTEVLIDPDEPSAKYWRTTRAIADADAGVHDDRLRAVATGLSDVAIAGMRAGRADARYNLETRFLTLRKGRDELLPKSGNALLLLNDSVAPTVTSTPIMVNGGTPDEYEQLVRAWRDAVRRDVQAGAPKGLLVAAPSTVVERIGSSPGVVLGSNALRTNRRPNDIELYTFCGAALVFVFLATGLHGVVSAKEPSSP